MAPGDVTADVTDEELAELVQLSAEAAAAWWSHADPLVHPNTEDRLSPFAAGRS
jgi:hypothetical protein